MLSFTPKLKQCIAKVRVGTIQTGKGQREGQKLRKEGSDGVGVNYSKMMAVNRLLRGKEAVKEKVIEMLMELPKIHHTHL